MEDHQFIAQKDEQCSICGGEIPRGSWITVNLYDEPICSDCVDSTSEPEYS